MVLSPRSGRQMMITVDHDARFSVARFAGFGLISNLLPSTEVLGYFQASASRTTHLVKY